METHKGTPFTGDGKTMSSYVMGMMGILLAHGAMMNATMRLDSANARSRRHLSGQRHRPGFFLFIDTIVIFGLPVPGFINVLPLPFSDGMKIFNLVIFAVVVAINVLGWKDAVLPTPTPRSPRACWRFP